MNDICLYSYYLQGVAAKQGKNSGVKKLLLVAAIPGAPENYATVKATLDRVDIDALEFTVAADVKMCKYYQSSQKVLKSNLT
jgi:hypothetical protein